jgi:hypothetical protein
MYFVAHRKIPQVSLNASWVVPDSPWIHTCTFRLPYLSFACTDICVVVHLPFTTTSKWSRYTHDCCPNSNTALSTTVVQVPKYLFSLQFPDVKAAPVLYRRLVVMRGSIAGGRPSPSESPYQLNNSIIQRHSSDGQWSRQRLLLIGRR